MSNILAIFVKILNIVRLAISGLLLVLIKMISISDLGVEPLVLWNGNYKNS